MNNFLLKFYFWLPQDSSLGFFSKAVNRIVAKFIKRILDFFVPRYLLKTQNDFKNGLNDGFRKMSVVVSLTSFKDRIDDVWIVVECLFRQSYKADRIILYLDQTNFTLDDLPVNLLNQTKRGLEIRFVKDLRSHTKYYYALKEFSGSYVVTVDDDCYYPHNLIENLFSIHKFFPNSIASNRVHKILFDRFSVKAYKNWHHNFNCKTPISGKFLLTGVSGVLYPPFLLDNSLFDKEVFLDKCLYADDIWISLTAFRLGVMIASNNTFNKDMISISKAGVPRLLDYNSKGSGNDQQLIALLNHYNLDVIDVLSTDKR